MRGQGVAVKRTSKSDTSETAVHFLLISSHPSASGMAAPLPPFVLKLDEGFYLPISTSPSVFLLILFLPSSAIVNPSSVIVKFPQ